MTSVVLFDFDKTIVNKDTGYCFIVYALHRNVFRSILAILVLPLAWIPYLSDRSRYLGNSLFLWLATVGINTNRLTELKQEFIADFVTAPTFRLFKDAITTIEQHMNNGHQIIIVSGSSEWMVKDTLRALDLPQIDIIASTEKYMLGGLVSGFHCYAQNKVTAVQKSLNLDAYSSIIGYSDSVSDIPMLSLCSDKHIVNPSAASKRRFSKTFGNDFKMHMWQ